MSEVYTFILNPAKSGRSDNNLEMPVRMERGTLELTTKEPNSQFPRRVAVITNRAGAQLVLEIDALAGLASLLHDMQAQGELK